ncbi:MAG: hypothetical protein COB66_04785 [Coxiella sp. (in: Bacteria)]|nr:MAG: hypothetical protein COB66_04785 [Coxiella sp. (in: g-proteobacteria)]
MDYTILTTRFLGIAFAVYGLAMLFNKGSVKDAGGELGSSKGLSLAVGFTQLFWGSFIVVVQQVWTNWSVMTTLAGWLIFIGAVCRLWMPNCTAKCDAGSSGGLIAFFGFIMFAWGVLMMFYGFFGSLDAMMNVVHHITNTGSTVAQ